MKKYDEYGIEQESINITPYIILGVIAFVVLIGIVILIFNLGNIKNFFFPKNEEQKTEETKNYKEDELKLVDGLVEPEISYANMYESKKFNIIMSDIEASSKGYTLTIKAISDTDKNYKIDCTRITIDGFDIDGNFSMQVEPHTTKQETVLLKKTDLEELEINNFKELSFSLYIMYDSEVEMKHTKVKMRDKVPVDNEKKGLIKIDEYSGLDISYYKKIEDSDNTYLYFDIDNKTNNNYNISINRLFVNGKLYDKELNIESLKQGEKIVYMKIPKKDIENVEKIKISFFSEKILKEKETGYEIRISQEKELTT